MANTLQALGPLQKVINASTGATVSIVDAEGNVVGFYGSYPIILNSGALTASALIKTGPAKVYNLLITSGDGAVTLRDGTTVAGALVSGWGGGGASGLDTAGEMTVNVPYSTANVPTDYANGIYAELSGTATFIVYYQ